MKPIGSTLAVLIVLLVLLGGTVTQAAVTASLDRDRVSMGDTVRLTITATEDEELNDADLRALLNDFQILQRSTSSNTSIVNGHMSHARQVIIDLTPTRQGNLQVPPLRIGQTTTQALPVVVSDAPDTPTDNQTVVFDAEVDQHSVYVQGQVILTLRVQQSVNLDGRNISELKLDNAFVKRLEQHSFQRTSGGRQWLVDEIRYAIFPEQSGTLEIPAQMFSGRANQRPRSFFDFGGGGQLLRRTSKPISINVLPKPDSFTADTWLPARGLTLTESWSKPPEQLRVGESATRTIRIEGEGLQGAQLPPIMFAPIDGLKYYPDQPQISEKEISGGLLGIRQDSAAVVPTRAGTYRFPGIRIPWWDTASKQVRYAELPEREITVLAAEPGDSPAVAAPPAAPVPTTAPVPESSAAVPMSTPATTPIWQILSAVSTAGWLLTLVYVWRRRPPRSPEQLLPPDNVPEKQAFKTLVAACNTGNAASARGAVINWAVSANPGTAAVSLAQVATQYGDREFTRELELLDRQLYSTGPGDWNGARLADCVRRLRGDENKTTRRKEEPLRLYPEAG
jgi:hypothetical protein